VAAAICRWSRAIFLFKLAGNLSSLSSTSLIWQSPFVPFICSKPNLGYADLLSMHREQTTKLFLSTRLLQRELVLGFLFGLVQNQMRQHQAETYRQDGDYFCARDDGDDAHKSSHGDRQHDAT
jgi:hypothetical protein